MSAVVNPIYRFRLAAGEDERITHAVWADSLAYDCQRESNEMFFRTKLSGNVVFVGKDADWIVGQPFDTRFDVYLDRSNDVGNTWFVEWTGFFHITDCDVNLDDKIISVKPDLADQYTKVLDGMEAEYNLIDLLPEIRPVEIQKHPMIQIYMSGDTVVNCIANGLAWEQEVDAVTDYDELREKYWFYVEDVQTVAKGMLEGSLYATYQGDIPDADAQGHLECTLNGDNGTYLYIEQYTRYDINFKVRRTSDDTELYWYNHHSVVGGMDVRNCAISMEPVSGSGANLDLSIVTNQICTRVLTNVETFEGVETKPLNPEDFSYNRNYHRVFSMSLGSRYLMASSATSLTPTEYGKKDDTHYWAKPSAQVDIYPVGRSWWDTSSLWFVNDGNIIGMIRNQGSQKMTLKTAYPLSSVINVLLAKMDPDVTHTETETCSEFLYASTNPVSGDAKVTLMVTPKSNILAGEFSQPATNAPITLRSVLDMLKNVYQCYWHIDDEGHFCIEHISYYKNGGSYDELPEVGTDLTQLMNVRNRKRLAFDTSSYKYEKMDMPERYEFQWMDEVTVPFRGKPIAVISEYVKKGMIESVAAGNFTTDMDYVLLCPENISKDGFMLMACRVSNNKLTIPDLTITAGTYPWTPDTMRLQNGLLAYCYLQPKYWLYDMAARSLMVNEVATQADGIKRTKTQEVQVPCYDEPNPMELIKTNLGNGYVKRMNVKLSSRMSKTTLVYEPVQ